MLRRISGDSMFPSFENGQTVFIKAARPISEGDVVMFLHNGLEKIKRVSGVDADKLYVLGDNPRFSTDSRHFGDIPLDTVVGKVIWPKT